MKACLLGVLLACCVSLGSASAADDDTPLTMCHLRVVQQCINQEYGKPDSNRLGLSVGDWCTAIAREKCG